MNATLSPAEASQSPLLAREPKWIEDATLARTADPRGLTPERNFGAGGQARTLVEVDRVYSDDEVVWQEDVYRFARTVFELQKASRIVDLGTGSGKKFVSIFAGLAADRIQVDWDDRRDASVAADRSEVSRFIAANLEDPADLERMSDELRDGPATVFVLSDVIEHLGDIRPILRVLRRLLRDHPGNRLVLSTPDRERIDGLGSTRMPDNIGHVRQWTASELARALFAAGFEVVRIGHVAQNNYDALNRTIVTELLCTPDTYARFLASHNLPKASDHLAVTTEHAEALFTGGIGSYYRYGDELEQVERIYLYCGAHGLPNDWRTFVRDRGWVHVAELTGQADKDTATASVVSPDANLAATLQLVFLYDNVKLIEYQDYVGIGARIAQAKRAGLLPPTVTVAAYAHGSHFYLDNASGAMLDVRRPDWVDPSERIAIEQADVTLFPSRFLHDLYTKIQGLQPRRVIHQSYPVKLRSKPVDELSRGPIDTLLFYGKQTPQKGYPEFCDAVAALFSEQGDREASRQIKRLILMGVHTPDRRLAELPGVEIVHGRYSLDEALAMLRAEATRCLAVLPYKADNQPLSIFEVVDADCQFIAFAAGGLPEVVPEELHGDLLCAPKAAALTAAIARQVRRPFWERSLLLDQTWTQFRNRSEAVRAQFEQTIAELKRPRILPEQPRGAVSVIVPNLNGDAHFFDDLALGLRNSFHAPKAVEVVDDGSDEDGLARLEAGVAKFGNLPVHITRNAKNLGLSGARNTGLERVTTPYICAHDNDNILLNRYLEVACRILDENPEVAAVTAWSWCFVDGTSWRARRERWDYEYRPLGQDLGSALWDNCFGDALAVYRTEVLRKLGGWDATSKGLWEDWQLFTRMTATGYKIWNIPAPMFLYRLRQNSMLQTYARLPGEARIGRALGSIPPAEGVSLIRAMRSNQKRVERVQDRLNTCRQERFKATAHRSREIVHFEAKLVAAHTRLRNAAEQLAIVRQEKFKNIANQSRTQVNFERQRTSKLKLKWPREKVANKFASDVNSISSGGKGRSYDDLISRLLTFVNGKKLMRNDEQYLEDRRLVEVSGLFDTNWYRTSNADLANMSDSELLDHFMQHGGVEGRAPSEYFSSSYYLSENQDIRDAGVNPLVHFLRYGADEGRYPAPPESV